MGATRFYGVGGFVLLFASTMFLGGAAGVALAYIEVFNNGACTAVAGFTATDCQLLAIQLQSMMKKMFIGGGIGLFAALAVLWNYRLNVQAQREATTEGADAD